MSLDHYRLLGRSGLRVSPLSLGTMTFRADGWGSSDEEAARMVDLYIDRGGNFLDTANFYGGMGGVGGTARPTGGAAASAAGDFDQVFAHHLAR